MRNAAKLAVLLFLLISVGSVRGEPNDDGVNGGSAVVGTTNSIDEIFRARVAAFDEAFKALLSRPEMLDKSGLVAQHLTSTELLNVEQLFRDTLGVELPREDVALFCRRMIQDARRAGRNWQNKLSVSKFCGASKASHGYLAEAVNFEDVRQEFPGQRIRFTKANSLSADIVVMREAASGKAIPIMGIQTKLRTAALDSLREGLDDAQTFYADKSFRVAFRVDIPKDQFEQLVRARIVSPNGQVIAAEQYIPRLKKNTDVALAAFDRQNGSNQFRLAAIPRRHGDIETYNRRVVEMTRIHSMTKTYQEVKTLEAEFTHLRSGLIERTAYAAYLKAMPSDFAVAKNAAAVAAAMTAVGIFIEEGTTWESVEKASEEASKVAAKSFASTYSAQGIMRKVGGKILFTTLIDTARMDSKQLSALTMKLDEAQRYLFAGHMAGAAFIATFIFDESGTVVSLVNGDQGGEEFLIATGKNLFSAGAVGSVTWASVVLGAAPAGLVIAAAAIGTHVIVAKVFETIELYGERQHLSLKDFVGKLPLEIQARITPFDPERFSVFEPLPRKTARVPDRESAFEIAPQKQSVFEP
jgi:hypothetical protein